jgi:hypothetical protein
MYINLYRFFYYKDNIMACSGPTNNAIGLPSKKTCNKTCTLSFSYMPTSLVAKTTDYGYIEFTPRDNSSAATVQYKSTPYVPHSFMVFNKPIHTFHTVGANEPVGELIISHTKEGSPNKLYICIPIQAIEDHPKRGKLGTILNQTANMDPTKEIQLTNFKFSDFIPKKTYYNYVGTPIHPIHGGGDNLCGTSCEYVVFSTVNSALYLTKDEATTLSNIGEHQVRTFDNDEIFMSDSPPGLMGGDDIWIDCTPVGQSGSEYVPISDAGGGVNFLKKISFDSIINMLTPQMPIVIGVLIMLGIWKLGNYLYSPKCTPTGAMCDLTSGKSHKCK